MKLGLSLFVAVVTTSVSASESAPPNERLPIHKLPECFCRSAAASQSRTMPTPAATSTQLAKGNFASRDGCIRDSGVSSAVTVSLRNAGCRMILVKGSAGISLCVTSKDSKSMSLNVGQTYGLRNVPMQKNYTRKTVQVKCTMRTF